MAISESLRGHLKPAMRGQLKTDRRERSETLIPTGKLASVGMGNVMVKAKQEQLIALGRLCWSLRRIEGATGVRRKTAGGYLPPLTVSPSSLDWSFSACASHLRLRLEQSYGVALQPQTRPALCGLESAKQFSQACF